MPKFYLTTAIDYSNGDPHLGQALEKIGADCIARYRRLRGDDAHFLMGMDEHSQSVIQAAARAGVTPQAWVDRMADRFTGFWRRLECSNDDWIRTTEPRHARAVTALLERIQRGRPSDLFEGEYEGLYCTGCEEFKTGAQIADGRCIEHPTLDLVPTKERNHFFRLSAYRDAVLERIRSGALSVEPEIRRNEVVRLLEAGLQDISISRQRQPWGIPFPGDAQQTVYVWFDALINYLSATGFPDSGYERLCALRYFLLREVGFANDGNFTWERFDARYTADLADTLGNLVSRALAMVERYRAGTVPRDPTGFATPLEQAARDHLAEYARAMDGFDLGGGAAAVIAHAARANRYVEETAPWKLAKENRAAELDTVLANLARTVARLAVLALPFVPTTAQAIWSLLGTGTPLDGVRLDALEAPQVEGRRVAKPPVLFPKRA